MLKYDPENEEWYEEGDYYEPTESFPSPAPDYGAGGGTPPPPSSAPAPTPSSEMTYGPMGKGQGYQGSGYSEQDYWGGGLYPHVQEGLDPARDIYDPATGQLRPGWTRDAGGYEGPNGGGGGVGGWPTWDGGGGGWGRWPDIPAAPRPNLPRFTAPPPFAYDPYTPGDPFRAPSVDELLQDPSYQWRKGQGEQSLQRWAAARGTLNDSGTATALQDYGQNAASQEYSNVWNRQFQGHQANEAQRLKAYETNRAGAVDTYNTNYGTQYVDPYRFEYQRETDLFAPEMARYRMQGQMASQQMGQDATNRFNRYLADLEQRRWQEEFALEQALAD